MNSYPEKNISPIRELTRGFSKLSRSEREQKLIQMGVLNSEDIAVLNHECALSSSVADHFIENAVGSFPLPLGLAVNFVIDGRDYVIPMAVEETSVIAGASKTAKWIAEKGEITTQNLSQLGVGQIQFPRVKNFYEFQKKVEDAKEELKNSANLEPAKGMVALGGGVQDIVIRRIPRENNEDMAVIHILVDTRDAMGANTINQVCEFLKPILEELTQERVGMCILSNLADSRITEAKVVLRDIDLELGNAIAEGSLFAQLDIYRAATNNKGVMNGIDPVLIATGNDWRAVEAGVHAYAALSGHYTSITQWVMKGSDLHGVIRAPILLGIVGGVTRLHPVAKICLKILNVKSAAELSRVVAAVGLVQNLAALTALVTEGINKGHMRLHISNVAMNANATESEFPLLQKALLKRLETNKRISSGDAQEILKELRKL